MKNRYDGVLNTFNRKILQFAPSNIVLRLVVAHEFKAAYKKGMRVLEIGCGEGDSAEPLLENTDVSLTLLDASPEMITSCKLNLARYSGRTSYACEDGFEYLKRTAPCDIITSSWTIHNFLWNNQVRLFKAIYRGLAPSGTFILMDKIYPLKGGNKLLAAQLRRYAYLPPHVRDAIVAHEQADHTRDYRMNEKDIIGYLEETGFCALKIVDRVERDAVIVARKGDTK